MAVGLPKEIAEQFRQKIATGEWLPGKKVPTTRELAASYQVSVNTIQSAFRELEAHDLMERRPRLGGYVKAKPTQAPTKSQSAMIAVIGPFTDENYADDADDWATRIIRGCDRELAEAQYHAAMFSYDAGKKNGADDISDAARERLLARLDRAGPTLAGAMCFQQPGMAWLLSELDKRDIPWVTINRSGEHATQNFVSHDAYDAGRLVGGCLAKMQIDRVAFLSPKLDTSRTCKDKLFGCIQGYVEFGGELRHVDFVRCDGRDEQIGFTRFEDYVRQYGRPGAVFTGGDLLALGVLRLCRKNDWRVPEDVAVVGSTGLLLAAYARPSLTVIDVPMERMGEQAAQMLLSMAREGTRRMLGRFVPGSLIVRESFRIPDEVVSEVSESIRQQS